MLVYHIIGFRTLSDYVMLRYEELYYSRFPWSPWLKAPRTGGTPTLTWTARIHSHTLHQHSFSYHFSVHSESVIHRPLTWATGSLTCVRAHSCASVYTRGLGTLTASQHNIFDSEKLTYIQFVFLCPDGIRNFVLWILGPTL